MAPWSYTPCYMAISMKASSDASHPPLCLLRERLNPESGAPCSKGISNRPICLKIGVGIGSAGAALKLDPVQRLVVLPTYRTLHFCFIPYSRAPTHVYVLQAVSQRLSTLTGANHERVAALQFTRVDLDMACIGMGAK